MNRSNVVEVCTDIEEANANGWALYQKVFELIVEQNPPMRLASNIVMNLVAALIVCASPSLEQAELKAEHAGKDIAKMVKMHWLGGKADAETLRVSN